MDAGEDAAIDLQCLGGLTRSQQRLGEQAPVIDRIGFVERLPAIAQLAAGIERADRRAPQPAGRARAEPAGQDFDDRVGDDSESRQE